MPACPITSEPQQWFASSELPWTLTDSWKSWLLDTGSLTERLKQAFPGDFQVQVLRQDWGTPRDDERHMLSMSSADIASIREVILHCNGSPKVFARSILPQSSLEGDNSELLSLDNRPLGAFLFARPDLQRGPIEITRVTDLQGHTVWGRRSLFMLKNKPLVVCEYFLHNSINQACRA